MISPVIAVTGDVVARTDAWVVTTDTQANPCFPVLPDGTLIRVLHMSHVVTCRHIASGKTVSFTKKKKHWHDSRMKRSVRKEHWFSARATAGDNDWRGDVIAEREVVAEVARMGGGSQAGPIVRALVG